MNVTEIRLAALNGINIPEGTTLGTSFTITAQLQVDSIEQKRVDVTTYSDDKPQFLPGPIIVKAVVIGDAQVTT